MRKLYLLLAGGLIAASAIGQSRAPQLPAHKRIAQPMPTKSYTGTEYIPSTPMNTSVRPEIEFYQSRDIVISQALIGITQYDLQSNASTEPRTLRIGDEIRGAWTMSLDGGTFPDRGTGFNEYVAGGWNSEPLERVEDVRIGWPAMVETANGDVHLISHAGIDTPWHIATRASGSSSWTEADLDLGDTPGHLWSRAAVGGDDGNTVHIIGVTTPEANGGAFYQQQDGAIIYWRSQDGGATWDIQNQTFPELGIDNFLGFDGDTYHIAARGNKVAFAVFNDLADSFIMISDDNGDTWEYKSLVDFPVDLYVVDEGLPEDQGEDFNEDGIFQEYYNTDGGGHVLIGLDGTVHVFYGEMYYMDADLTDTNFSYFPGSNGLSYWNDTMEENMYETIAFAYDLDESATLDLDEIALYFASLSGMPTAGIDADGNIYVSYAAIMESHSTGQQNYRHIYIVKSEDGGVTWNTENACNVTPDSDFDFFEAVFPSMSPVVDDEIHLIYQRDFEPGLHVRGDEDPIDLNDYIYLGIPTADLDACGEGGEVEYVGLDEIIDPSTVNIYPNPASDILNVIMDNKGTYDILIYDAIGNVVLSTNTSQLLTKLDVSEFASGVYIMNISNSVSTVSKRINVK